MNVSDFYYDLPEELIAQTPIEKRDESRLMVLNRANQTIEQFSQQVLIQMRVLIQELKLDSLWSFGIQVST